MSFDLDDYIIKDFLLKGGFGLEKESLRVDQHGYLSHTRHPFLGNPYIDLYNQRKIVLSIGQVKWQREGIRTIRILEDIFHRLDIHAWIDLWGYDVDHDWPW